MKLSRLIGERFKERPADCVIDSHALMLRGGYMKYVANGIYSSYLPLRRITRRIEQIIREEMDALDGQEVQLPVALPASLWEESGRYESVGQELLRFSDRNSSPMVLGMTHEEAAVALVRDYGSTYSRYPFMIYQIQTKFRDELRPRAGLIRVREFTMKDAYSFHTSKEDLNDYYMKCHAAYGRIFARAGIPEVVSVASDSGMMGGDISHEFMLLTPAGEDSVACCDACGYHANIETFPADIRHNSSAAADMQQDKTRSSAESARAPGCDDGRFLDAVCPSCGKHALILRRGIEVGNIFQLGQKYTASMHMTYVDKDGSVKIPVMGCYGIGIGRLAASVCEAHHDEHGPIWPVSIAPWKVHLCAVRADHAEVRQTADLLYRQLTDARIDVIYDDRPVRAGIMFSDADLIGAPVRIIVSPRNLAEGCCEIAARDGSFQKKTRVKQVREAIEALFS